MHSVVPFARPDITEEEIAAVVECLRSGWLTSGPRTEQFERDFAAVVHPAAAAVAVNSATAGLHLALEALGVGPGDTVVVPVYTFTATAEVLRYLGADPVFVDVCADTLNASAESLEAAIVSTTKAVMPVHVAGLACDMDTILPMARSRGVAVVDDAAHALPATHNGTLVGAFDTDATVFSFYATKTLTTGEGGMIVTSREDIAARCRLMRLHGVQKAAPDGTAQNGRYDVREAGFKYNLTDLASSIGIVQLRRLQAMADRRSIIARQYFAAFADLPVALPTPAPTGEVHSWHLFIVRLLDDFPHSRDRFIELMHQRGVECSIHFIPLHLHTYWRDRYALVPGMFPNADEAARRVVSLPIHSGMSNSDVEQVIDAVRHAAAR